MAGTAAFLKAWRTSGRKGVALVRVEVADPAYTLQVATTETDTPDGNLWRAGLESGEVRAPGSYGTTRFETCTATLTLVRDVLDAVGAARLRGSAVTIWLWERTLTDFADALQIFKGQIVTHAVSMRGAVIQCMQRADFNREVPTRIITGPRVPESSRGKVPAICYGSLRPLPMRVGPWTAEYGDIPSGPNGLTLIAGGRRTVPGVPTDIRRGAGGEPTKVVFAGHKVKMLGNDNDGTPLWMEQEGKVCRLQPGVVVANCECTASVASVTRASGSFVTDGVRKGSMLFNVLATKFPPYTTVTNVTASTLTTSVAATAGTSGTPVKGEFLDVFNNDTDGAGMFVADKESGGVDPFTTLFVPILPSNVELVTDNAESPRAVLDPLNDTNYARLEYGGGGIGQFRALQVRFPSLSEQGDLVSADCEVGVELVSGTIGSNVKLRVDAGGGNFSEITLPTPSPNPGYVGVSLGTTWGQGGLPSTPWQFGQTAASVYFSGSQNAILRIYAIGLTIRVRPTSGIIAERVALVPTRVDKTEPGPLGKWTPQRYWTTEMLPGTLPVYGPLLSPFFANIDGWADDGSGTDSGVANALLERNPDIMRHLLKKYGGQSSGDIKTGSGFGSFDDARAMLKTWRQGDMRYAFAILERTPVARILEALAADALCWYYLDRFTDKFHCVPWRPGPLTPDYGVAIPRDWVSEGEVDWEDYPATEVISGVEVPYSMDHATKSLLHSVSIGPERSSSGHRWRSVRDQQLTVIASGADQNDTIRVRLASSPTTNRSRVLTPGDYDPASFAQEVASEIDAIGISAGSIVLNTKVGYGPLLIANYNTRMVINDGATVSFDLDAGDYGTMEALAAHVQSKLNSVSTLWSCSYSRTTRKITISRSSGTAQLLWGTGTFLGRSAQVTLGYVRANKTSSPMVADNETEEQRFVVGTTTNDDLSALAWDGLSASCATLLGFDGARDVLGSLFTAHSPKSNMEQTCALAEARYGGRHEMKVPGTTIQDTDTAREVAMRAVRIFTEPHEPIRFSSSYMVDIERGRVFAFDSSLGNYPGEAGGDWDDHAFVVVETFTRFNQREFTTEIGASRG